MADTSRETCDECGFDAAERSIADLGARARALADEWAATLDRNGADQLHRRPSPEVWSAVEYTVHTARVVEYWVDAASQLVRGERIEMSEDTYPDADRLPFNETRPAAAVTDLRDQLGQLTQWAGDASDDELAAPLRTTNDQLDAMWHRAGIPDVAAALRHALHDVEHHLDDIKRGLASIGGTDSGPA